MDFLSFKRQKQSFRCGNQDWDGFQTKRGSLKRAFLDWSACGRGLTLETQKIHIFTNFKIFYFFKNNENTCFSWFSAIFGVFGCLLFPRTTTNNGDPPLSVAGAGAPIEENSFNRTPFWFRIENLILTIFGSEELFHSMFRLVFGVIIVLFHSNV